MSDLDLEKIQSDPTLSYCLDTFFGYASHAIQDKAIPNFFDGLLPSQRRLCFAMQDVRAFPGRKSIKSTLICSRATGYYSPQGGGIYNVLVNMSQPYKVPILLTDPEGNWGEQENFIPAAERYTETKLSKFAMEVLLHDLPKGRLSSKAIPHGIVPTQTNWEGSLLEEEYLPARLPILLMNGSSGIAVGIAQTFQPLEYVSLLTELKSFIGTGEINYSNLKPGHPTNCACVSSPEVFQEALKTGDGNIRLAARFYTEGEDRRGRFKIIITTVPPYTSFNAVGNKFNDWRRSDPLCPFKSFRNESSNDEIRLVFEFKKGDMPKNSSEVQLHVQQLYKKLTLVTTVNIKMIALKGRYPVQYNVQSFFEDWVQERSNIIQRISEEKAQSFGQEKHKYDLLKWVKQEFEFIISILEDSESEEDIQTRINLRREVCFVPKLVPGDMKIIFSMNLRQLSKISEEELLLKSELMTEKWKAHRFLVENESVRKDQIKSDIDYFLKNAKSLGVQQTSTDFDEELATLLEATITSIRRTMEKPVNPFKEYLDKKSDTTDILVQTESGFFVRVSTRSVRTTPMLPKLALVSDKIVHANLTNQGYLFFITNTGKLFAIHKGDVPYNSPTHWSKVLDKSGINTAGVESIHAVIVFSDSPTHLMLYLQDGSFKKVNLAKINSMRTTIIIPAPIKFVGFIGREELPLIHEGESKFSYLNPNEVRESSVRKGGRIPKVMSMGVPTRILKGIGIKHETGSIQKILQN